MSTSPPFPPWGPRFALGRHRQGHRSGTAAGTVRAPSGTTLR